MESIKNELSEQLRRICDIANHIIASESDIPLIEKDLLLQELRNMYGTALRIENSEWQSVIASSESLFAPEEDQEPEAIGEPLMELVEDNDFPFDEPQSENPIDNSVSTAPDTVLVKTAESELELPEHIENEAVPESQQPAPSPAETEIIVEAITAVEPPTTDAAPAAEPQPIEEQPVAETPQQPTVAPVTTVEKAEPVTQQQPVTEVHPDTTVQKPVEAEKAEQPKSQPSLFDYIKAGDKTEKSNMETLGDRLGKGVSIEADSMNKKKVDDLRSVININDKFSFMSELFHSNMKAYNDFILMLNAIPDRETALARVEEVAQLNNWDKNSIVVNTFYKIFNRKF